MEILIERLSEDASLPHQGSEEAAGYDVFVSKETLINPKETVLVPLGFAMAIPKGYHAKLVLRSSTGLKTNLRLGNQVGIIDSDYRGEVKLIMTNIGNHPVRLFKDERVAQMLIEKNIEATFKVVDKLPETKRGKGGFGSTGKTKKGN